MDVKGARFYVAFNSNNEIPRHYWRYFAAMPPIYIAPYWPWVAIADTNDPDGWKEIIEFASASGRKTFELHPNLIDKLFAVRPAG
jgi:hypothetical protein